MAGQGCPSTRRHVRGRRSELNLYGGASSAKAGHVRREATIGLEHPPIVVVRVPSARVRHDEDVAVRQTPGLGSERERTAWPEGPRKGQANQPDHQGARAANRALERAPASHVIGRPQCVDSPRRSRNQVGEPDPELGQPSIVGERQRLRCQGRFVEQPPEAIAVTGEMVPERCGAQAWIDAHEQHVESRDRGDRADPALRATWSSCEREYESCVMSCEL